jgi:hypothetical protein
LEFEAAPPEWFREKGINTPVWCPDCRKWRDAQVDEAVRCIECGEGIRLSRRLKISIHKKEGPFRRPEKCKLCESGKRKKQAPRVKRPERTLSESFLRALNRFPSTETVVEVTLDTADYQLIRKKDGRTNQAHIEHHIDGHPNSLVGQVIDGREKTPSSLVPYGASFEDLVAAAAEVARVTDPSTVRQYTATNGYIVKIYPGEPGHAELVVINPKGSTPKLVTSFDRVTLGYAIGVAKSAKKK